MLAIFKKEIKIFFSTVIGWLFCAALLFFFGLYFTIYNLIYGTPYISYTLSAVIIVFLFSIPILTMKIFADEKRLKTDQMLFTAPISLWKIIVGKYLAMVAILFGILCIFSLYPIILSTAGTIPFGETYIAVFGFFLFGAACIAIGLFISSLTENIVIAAVLTFGALLISFLVNGLTSFISAQGNLITKILSAFAMSTRLDNLLNGIIDLQSILYFLTVIGICLFLTYMTLEKRRWSVAGSGIKKGVFSSITTIIIPVVLIALNIGAGYLPETYTKLDITDEKLYSITDTTKDFLSNLDQDITIYVLGSEDSADITIKTLLTRYSSQSSHIKVEYKDTAVYPNFASGYTTDTLADSSMIVECGDKSTVIAFDDCYEYEIDYTTYESTATGFDGEGQITAALSYVTSDSLPTIWFLNGHQEYEEISETATANIKKENIAMETVNLMNYETIPDTISCIVICGAVVDYSADDIIKLEEYMSNGGNVIILAAFSDQEMPNLNGFIKEYGLEMQDGVVFESNENNYYQYPYYVLPSVNSNTITSNIYSNNRYILMPQPVGMVETTEEEEDLTVTVLLESTDQSICKTDVTNMESWDFEEGDIQGPFVLGAVVNQTSTNAKLVVYACEYLLADDIDSMVSGANTTLFSDTVASMVDHESSIAIPVKEYILSSVIMNQMTIIILSIIVVGILPIITLGTGIVIWVIRRKK